MSTAADATRRVTVALGQTSASWPDATTWEWDGVVWTERAPEHAPPARTATSLAYDVAHGEVRPSIPLAREGERLGVPVIGLDGV